MKMNTWRIRALLMFAVGVTLIFSFIPASATHDPFVVVAGNGFEADLCHDFSKCGYNGPLIWNPYTVVSSGIIWTKKHWDIPMLHGTRRGSEFGQSEFSDSDLF